MKKYLIVLFLIILVPAFSMGQDQETKAQGYAFAGIGQYHSASALHFGGGGEVDLYKGFGFGIEIGYIGHTREMSSGFGILSTNGRYAFQGFTDSKLVPYVTAGYSRRFRIGGTNAVNFGGGIDYWFAEKYGFKLEFRDHYIADWYNNYHAYQVRGGISFR